MGKVADAMLKAGDLGECVVRDVEFLEGGEAF